MFSIKERTAGPGGAALPVVRHLVGYDRFEGQKAWLQLRELHRAIRLYVNFFQPSMKLQIKHRDGAKVQRIYDPARTPFQRVRCAFNATGTGGTEKLDEIYRTLDPVRLLEQIGTLQDALWRHAVPGNGEITSVPREVKTAPEVMFKTNTVSLSVRDGDTAGGERKTRKYHRTKEPRSPALPYPPGEQNEYSTMGPPNRTTLIFFNFGLDNGANLTERR